MRGANLLISGTTHSRRRRSFKGFEGFQGHFTVRTGGAGNRIASRLVDDPLYALWATAAPAVISYSLHWWPCNLKGMKGLLTSKRISIFPTMSENFFNNLLYFYSIRVCLFMVLWDTGDILYLYIHIYIYVYMYITALVIYRLCTRRLSQDCFSPEQDLSSNYLHRMSWLWFPFFFPEMMHTAMLWRGQVIWNTISSYLHRGHTQSIWYNPLASMSYE